MKHRPRPALVALVALSVCLASASAASAASAGGSKSVDIKLFKFRPSKVAVAMGGTVVWTNDDQEAHTTTSVGGAGVGLWDSGGIVHGSQFSSGFAAAGGYPYLCTYHQSMRGTVQVAPKAALKGGSKPKISVTWASGAVPAGFHEDIQVQTPGGSWQDWLTGQTGSQTHATYAPKAGAGVYLFQARLVNDGSGGTSDWSPAAQVTVG